MTPICENAGIRTRERFGSPQVGRLPDEKRQLLAVALGVDASKIDKESVEFRRTGHKNINGTVFDRARTVLAEAILKNGYLRRFPLSEFGMTAPRLEVDKSLDNSDDYFVRFQVGSIKIAFFQNGPACTANRIVEMACVPENFLAEAQDGDAIVKYLGQFVLGTNNFVVEQLRVNQNNRFGAKTVSLRETSYNTQEKVERLQSAQKVFAICLDI